MIEPTKPYAPNKYVKAMLILDRLDEYHVQAKNEILEALGITQDELTEVIGWLTVKGSDHDLSKAPPFFDYKG
jgi:hypothetical protein